MRRATLIAGGVAVAMLCGCKIGVTLPLFTSDLAAVTDGATTLAANATLSIDTSTEKNCTEHSPALLDALTAGFGGAEFLGCRDSGMDSFADFRVAVPMAAAVTPGLMAITASRDGQRVTATLRSDPRQVEKLVNSLPEKLKNAYNGRLDPIITVDLQNDLPGAVTLAMGGVWIDGAPVQTLNPKPIDRRGAVSIRLSDVGNAAAMTGGAIIAAFDLQ